MAEPKEGTPAIEMLDALPPEIAEKYRKPSPLLRSEDALPQKALLRSRAGAGLRFD